MWEGKTYGTVIHSKIHYVNGYAYNHVLPVQQSEQNKDSSYKELSQTQELQRQEIKQHQSFKTDNNEMTSDQKDSGNKILTPPCKSTTPLPSFRSIKEDCTVGCTKHSRQHCWRTVTISFTRTQTKEDPTVEFKSLWWTTNPPTEEASHKISAP